MERLARLGHGGTEGKNHLSPRGFPRGPFCDRIKRPRLGSMCSQGSDTVRSSLGPIETERNPWDTVQVSALSRDLLHGAIGSLSPMKPYTAPLSLLCLGLSVIPPASAQLPDVIASYGTDFAGTLAGSLDADGETLTVPGAFVSSVTGAPASDPDYSGSIVAGLRFVKSPGISAEVGVYAGPASLRLGSGGSGDYSGPADWSVIITFDFSNVGAAGGAGTGYLRAGSSWALLDFDGNSGPSGSSPAASLLPSVKAYDSTGAVVTTAWLGTFAYFDSGIGGGGDPTSPGQPDPVYADGDYGTHSFSGGVYEFTSSTHATASPVIMAPTLTDIRRIEFTYFGAKLEHTHFMFGGPVAVPEPGAPLLVCGRGNDGANAPPPTEQFVA